MNLSLSLSFSLSLSLSLSLYIYIYIPLIAHPCPGDTPHHHHPSLHFYRRMLGCGEPPYPGPGGRQAAQLPNHTRPRQDHLNLGWSRRVGCVGVGPP